MNLWEAIIDATDETEAGTPGSATVPTLQQLVRWANQARDILADRTGAIQKLVTFSSVANQEIYTPGAEVIRPVYGEWLESTSSRHRLVYQDDIEYRRNQERYYTTGTPQFLGYWDHKFRIFPAVSSAAGTGVLSGNHSAVATTITAVSTSGFPTRGRIIIDSEVIEYTGLTATTFTGCTRGVEGTTAAAHTSAAVITERDLWFWCVARYLVRDMNIYNTGTAVFTNASTAVVGTSTYWAANAYAGWKIGTGTNPSKWYDISSVTDNTNIVLTAAYGEATSSVTTDYVIASTIDLPVQWQHAITQYLIWKTWRRLEEDKNADRAEREFYRTIDQMHGEMVQRTDMAYNTFHDADMYDP